MDGAAGECAVRWLQLIPHLDPVAVIAAAGLFTFAVGTGVVLVRNVLANRRAGRRPGQAGRGDGEREGEGGTHPLQ